MDTTEKAFEQFPIGSVRPMFKVVMISPLPPESTGESPYTAALIDKLAANGNVRIYAITGPDANELPNYSVGKLETGNHPGLFFILFSGELCPGLYYRSA